MTITNKIKAWYTETFKDDEVGATLNEDSSFIGLVQCLECGNDVYDFLGGDADSITRERVFEKCAEIYRVDYDVIYKQWLANTK